MEGGCQNLTPMSRGSSGARLEPGWKADCWIWTLWDGLAWDGLSSQEVFYVQVRGTLMPSDPLHALGAPEVLGKETQGALCHQKQKIL